VELNAAVALLQGREWATSEDAWEAIFAVACARWGYFLRQTYGHDQDAEDLLVDTVVAVAKSVVRNGQPLDHPISYVLKSADRVWARKSKSKLSERSALQSYYQDILRLAHGEMARTNSTVENHRDLARAITELPDGERIAVLTHGLMGLSLADTAEYLGVSKSTVQTSFNRGIRKLQQRPICLEQNRGVTPQ